MRVPLCKQLLHATIAIILLEVSVCDQSRIDRDPIFPQLLRVARQTLRAGGLLDRADQNGDLPVPAFEKCANRHTACLSVIDNHELYRRIPMLREIIDKNDRDIVGGKACNIWSLQVNRGNDQRVDALLKQVIQISSLDLLALIAVCNNQHIARSGNRQVDPLNDAAQKNLADIRHDHADCHACLRLKRTRNFIRNVTAVVQTCQHPRPGLRLDVSLAVYNTGYCRSREIQLLRHIF